MKESTKENMRNERNHEEEEILEVLSAAYLTAPTCGSDEERIHRLKEIFNEIIDVKSHSVIDPADYSTTLPSLLSLLVSPSYLGNTNKSIRLLAVLNCIALQVIYANVNGNILLHISNEDLIKIFGEMNALLSGLTSYELRFNCGILIMLRRYRSQFALLNLLSDEDIEVRGKAEKTMSDLLEALLDIEHKFSSLKMKTTIKVIIWHCFVALEGVIPAKLLFRVESSIIGRAESEILLKGHLDATNVSEHFSEF